MFFKGKNAPKVGTTNSYFVRVFPPTKGPHNGCYKFVIHPQALKTNPNSLQSLIINESSNYMIVLRITLIGGQQRDRSHGWG
jgi:hypothetical protein